MAQPKGPKAPDQLVFLLSLVPYLLEQRVVDVATAAQHFGVAERELRDAVRLIATSGLPGATGTYQANDLFDIDWDAFDDDDVIVIVHHVAIDDAPRLSAREAAALIAGLQYLSALPENSGSTQLPALLEKLTAGASSEPTRLAVAETAADETLAEARRAVTEGRQLEFDYRNALGERGRRTVDPLRIASLGADWYLQAYCHTREDVRNFRIDRMSALRVTELPVGDHSDREFSEALFHGSDTDLDVVVDIVPDALPLIADYLADSSAEDVDGRSRVTLRLAHYHGLKRLVAGLPGLVTVVAPAEARAVVAEWAAAGLAASAEASGA
ncbi:helix-turn-helix transcriptional regulator [Agromyces aerolatus]|uniref:helix-turn-helix transcriptional regulator n=1 Tax=Agromyces sp. LY-1074 TaxID=3074080 RepID=UPI0028606CE2|nr:MULTISPECIES: WYL domain-containing protein [unclassified Agromyces]MDR5700092.1 WYL domain-containing protein [Agromyces sp. LY-1074]MDR5706540.1 WYL domain-containing protein [Agromyces sp. LY-1358]